MYKSRKIGSNIKPKESKPPLVSQQCVVYHFKCDLCDADYVGYTCRHLYQRIEEHKGSAIGKDVRDQHGRDPSDISLRFKILRKCQSKFDCLIYEMLFIKELKPTLNTQSDSIRAKLFFIAQSTLYILLSYCFLACFLLYCSFYHLPFVTLSTYSHILSLFIFSCVILLLISKIQFAFFFRLENDLGEIETSSNFILVFILKCVSKKLLIRNFQTLCLCKFSLRSNISFGLISYYKTAGKRAKVTTNVMQLKYD